MESYRSTSGKPSGVVGYEIGEGYIEVQFKGKDVYRYTDAEYGTVAISTMINKAIEQNGLSTFIAQSRFKGRKLR